MPIYMRIGKLRGSTSKDAMPVGPFRTVHASGQCPRSRSLRSGRRGHARDRSSRSGIAQEHEDRREAARSPARSRRSSSVARARDLRDCAREDRSGRRHRRAPAASRRCARSQAPLEACAAPEPRSRRPSVAAERRRPRRQPRTPRTAADAAEAPEAAEAVDALLAHERVARPRAAQAGCSSPPRSSPRTASARGYRPRASTRLRFRASSTAGGDPLLAEPLLGLGALALLALRARDHAVRHGARSSCSS